VLILGNTPPPRARRKKNIGQCYLGKKYGKVEEKKKGKRHKIKGKVKLKSK
jgi:hypothetical protein